MPEERKLLIVSSIPPRGIPQWKSEDDRKAGKPPRPQWTDLALRTCATHEKYAKKWGFGYRLDVSDIWTATSSPYVNQRNIPPYDSPIRYLIKFRLLFHYLSMERCGEEWDYVVWVDADCLFTNYDIPLWKFTNEKGLGDGDGPFPGDIVIPFDPNALHPTIIIARNSDLTVGFFWACSNIGERLFKEHEWNDNLAIRFFGGWPPYQALIHPWHSAQTLCAQHPGIYPIPERIRKHYEWTPESLTLHLSALDIEDRIKLAEEYIERLKLLE